MAVFRVETVFLVEAEDSRAACGVLDKHLGGRYQHMDDPEPWDKELDSYDANNLIA